MKKLIASILLLYCLTAFGTVALAWNNQGAWGTASGITLSGQTAGDMIYYNGSAWSRLTLGTSGYLLRAGAASAPEYVEKVPVANGGTNLSSYTTGDLLYADSATSLAKLALGTQYYVLTAGASGPEYSANLSVDTINLASIDKYTVVGTQITQTTATYLYATFDASSTGNTLKQYKSNILTHPCVFGSAVTQQTTVTARTYGQGLFADDVEANNYIEYEWKVPWNMDTSVDPVGYFTFRLGGADTATHDYYASMIDIAASSDGDTAVGDAVDLTYNADASGADRDIEVATATLTGWGAALTPGSICYIRITRDGDGTDASTTDSYSICFEIYYKESQ